MVSVLEQGTILKDSMPNVNKYVFHFLQTHQACKRFICNDSVRNGPHKHVEEEWGICEAQPL